ncbi:MAG: hypothetical protein GXY52_06105 [Chloroflexi bacterium]|nr:hypothetical protein [Chloroflexota bacterium]
MCLFKKKVTNRCPECRYYLMVEGHGYCAKAVDPSTNLRLLSGDAIRRQCPPCPREMTCPDWAAKEN